MRDEPFFEPAPDPEEIPDEGEQLLDIPWIPPTHIAGVVAPLSIDLYRSTDVVSKITHVDCYRRGLALHISTWVRPGSQPRQTDQRHHWRDHEPRVGVRLADGTRLGHRHPHSPPPEELEGAESPDEPHVSLTQMGGGGEMGRASSSWWLYPIPEGDSLEVVVEWSQAGVPESSARIDLAALRDAAAREDVLWDAPPPPGDGSFGWFAYGPMSGSAFSSHVSIAPDPQELDDNAGPQSR